MSSSRSSLIATCRAHGHWFPVERVHDPCPEPACEAACDYYGLLSDAELLHRSRAFPASIRIPDDGIPPTAIGGIDD